MSLKCVFCQFHTNKECLNHVNDLSMHFLGSKLYEKVGSFVSVVWFSYENVHINLRWPPTEPY